MPGMNKSNHICLLAAVSVCDTSAYQKQASLRRLNTMLQFIVILAVVAGYSRADLDTLTSVPRAEFKTGSMVLASQDRIPQASRTGRRGVCVVDGRAYPEGVFSIPGAECIKYNCEYDGMYYFVQQACRFRNRCWRVGQQYYDEFDCQKYVCTVTDLDNGRMAFASTLVKPLMCLVNGRCHRVGEEFVQDCNRYRCTGTSDDPSGYPLEYLGPGGC